MKPMPIATVLFASCLLAACYREPDAQREAAEQRAQADAIARAEVDARVRARAATLAELERRARLYQTAVANLEGALAGTCAAISKPRPAPISYRVPVAPSDPSRGPANAPVTLVLFIDLQSSSAPRLRAIVEQLAKDYGDKLRVVYKPLLISDFYRDEAVAEAALCAHRQGAFWSYYDQLFDHQSPDAGVDDPEDQDLEGYANAVGIDIDAWRSCFAAHATKGLIDASQALVKELGVRAPTAFVNGRRLDEPRRHADVQRVIDEELAGHGATAVADPLESAVHRLVVDAATPRRGPSDAKVQLVVFFDLRSFAWLGLSKVLRRLELHYPGKLAIAYKHFPEAGDSISYDVALGAVCAHEAGHLWDLEAILEPRPMRVRDTEELTQLINRAGVPSERIDHCRTSAAARAVVDRDVAEGMALGVRDAATIFINGRRFNSRSGSNSFDELSVVIDTNILAEGSK